MMKIGEKISDFALEDVNGKSISLSQFSSQCYVLFFYPKDNTPGCTIEAKEFSTLVNDFEKQNTKIIGISGGNQKSKQKFCEKNNLHVILLSDFDYSYCNKLGLYVKKKFMGREYMGIERTTVILDDSYTIIQIFEKVNPLGHAKKVLDWIKTHTN